MEKKTAQTLVIVGVALAAVGVFALLTRPAAAAPAAKPGPITPVKPPASPQGWVRQSLPHPIPANTFFAVALPDGASARALFSAFQTMGDFAIVEPGSLRPTDWPVGDEEGGFALRGWGKVGIDVEVPTATGIWTRG